jgi:hypothetical protein
MQRQGILHLSFFLKAALVEIPFLFMHLALIILLRNKNIDHLKLLNLNCP